MKKILLLFFALVTFTFAGFITDPIPGDCPDSELVGSTTYYKLDLYNTHVSSHDNYRNYHLYNSTASDGITCDYYYAGSDGYTYHHDYHTSTTPPPPDCPSGYKPDPNNSGQCIPDDCYGPNKYKNNGSCIDCSMYLTSSDISSCVCSALGSTYVPTATISINVIDTDTNISYSSSTEKCLNGVTFDTLTMPNPVDTNDSNISNYDFNNTILDTNISTVDTNDSNISNYDFNSTSQSNLLLDKLTADLKNFINEYKKSVYDIRIDNTNKFNSRTSNDNLNTDKVVNATNNLNSGISSMSSKIDTTNNKLDTLVGDTTDTSGQVLGDIANIGLTDFNSSFNDDSNFTHSYTSQELQDIAAADYVDFSDKATNAILSAFNNIDYGVLDFFAVSSYDFQDYSIPQLHIGSAVFTGKLMDANFLNSLPWGYMKLALLLATLLGGVKYILDRLF